MKCVNLECDHTAVVDIFCEICARKYLGGESMSIESQQVSLPAIKLENKKVKWQRDGETIYEDDVFDLLPEVLACNFSDYNEVAEKLNKRVTPKELAK